MCISFVKILYNVTRPHTARLGNIPGTNVYRNATQYPNATTVPGILAIRVDAAIYFSNSNYIHDKILHFLEEENQRIEKSNGKPIQYLIVDLTRKPSNQNTKTFSDCEPLALISRVKALPFLAKSLTAGGLFVTQLLQILIRVGSSHLRSSKRF